MKRSNFVYQENQYKGALLPCTLVDFNRKVDSDAMVDIHEGDLIATEMTFHVYGPKNHPIQRTSFSNIIKLKEIE